jgi:uncharacterized protein YecA (UPF0149 family)
MEELKKNHEAQHDPEKAMALKEKLDKELDKVIAQNDPDMCGNCHKKPAFKTNGNGIPLCERCADPATLPLQVIQPPGRNTPCPCGSGKKFKTCCINIIVKKYV